MKQLSFFISLIIVLASSCKNEDFIVPVTEDPKLNVSFKIDGNELSLIAGIEGYYMNTYYTQDLDSSISHGVGTFSGKMHHYEQENINNKIEFRLRNHHSGSISNSDLDVVLQSDSLYYYNPINDVFYEVEFSIDPLVNAESVVWDFGDGNTGFGETTTHLYKKEGGVDKYYVCVTVVYQGGCTDNICSDVIPFSANCDADIQVELDANNDVQFSVINLKGRAPFTYEWLFENGIIANTAEVKFVYGPSKSFIEHAKLTVTDASGCTTRVAKKYDVGNSGLCYTNFISTSKGQITYTNVLGYSEVEIIYTDELGNEFSTFNDQQNANNFFSILNYGNFMLNYENIPTKYLDIEFDCTLFDSQGNTLNLANGKGRIALAYPQ